MKQPMGGGGGGGVWRWLLWSSHADDFGFPEVNGQMSRMRIAGKITILASSGTRHYGDVQLAMEAKLALGVLGLV